MMSKSGERCCAECLCAYEPSKFSPFRQHVCIACGEKHDAARPKVSPSCEFTVGQTVWLKRTKQEAIVHGAVGLWLWLDMLDARQPATTMADDCTATDPSQSAEPVPQACPFCGKKATINSDGNIFRVSCPSINCNLVGPFKSIVLEAIAAWNSIGILSVPAKKPYRCEETWSGVRCLLPNGHPRFHEFNMQEFRELGDARCPIFIGGERCGKDAGHEGKHVWDLGD